MQKKIIVAIGALFISSVQAKIVHNYRVSTTVKNSNGKFMEFGKMILGWSCSSWADTSFTEVMVDQRGNKKRVEQSSKFDYNFSTLWQGQPAYQQSVTRSFNNEYPELFVSVNERCSNSKRVQELVTKTREVADGKDANGNTQYRTETYTEWETVTKTVYAHQQWNCRFDQMPNEVGESLKMSCNPKQNWPWLTGDTEHFVIEDMVLLFMNDKEIDVDLNLLSEQEQFIKLNEASRDNTDRFVFNISQGLRQGMLGDDFKITVSVNGASKTLASTHGLLNEDYVYYANANEESIEIKVTALEEDMMFDDVFENHTTARMFRGSSSERTILLNHGPYHSNIKVKALISPAIVKSSQKVSADVAQNMLAAYEQKRQQVVAEVTAIDELEAALSKAEDKYDFAKKVSIPVMVVGTTVTAVGAYVFKNQGVSAKSVSLLLGGALVTAGGATHLMLTRAQAKKLLAELIGKRKKYEDLLNELDEKSMNLHKVTSPVNTPA